MSEPNVARPCASEPNRYTAATSSCVSKKANGYRVFHKALSALLSRHNTYGQAQNLPLPTPDSGSRFLVPGSQFSVPGSQFLVLGSWFLVLGSWFLVLGSWFLVLSSQFLVHLQETFSDVVKTDKTGLSKTAHTRWMISAFANFLPGSTIFRLA